MIQSFAHKDNLLFSFSTSSFSHLSIFYFIVIFILRTGAFFMYCLPRKTSLAFAATQRVILFSTFSSSYFLAMISPSWVWLCDATRERIRILLCFRESRIPAKATRNFDIIYRSREVGWLRIRERETGKEIVRRNNQDELATTILWKHVCKTRTSQKELFQNFSGHFLLPYLYF